MVRVEAVFAAISGPRKGNPMSDSAREPQAPKLPIIQFASAPLMQMVVRVDRSNWPDLGTKAIEMWIPFAVDERGRWTPRIHPLEKALPHEQVRLIGRSILDLFSRVDTRPDIRAFARIWEGIEFVELPPEI